MLSPRDQIVESIEIGRKADCNPRNGAPHNDSVPHVMPLLPRRPDSADAGFLSRNSSSRAGSRRNFVPIR